MSELKNTQQLKKFNILLLGDDCIDIYQYGTIDRLSPEAPVPIFNLSYEERKPGMAANVCENLEKLGCEVVFYTGKTSKKTRLIDIKSGQHIVRIDEDEKSDEMTFSSNFSFSPYDAVVVSDYNKGAVSYDLLKSLKELYDGPIFVDTKKKDLKILEGCFVKINELEYNQATSLCSNIIVTLGAMGAMFNDKKYFSPKVEVADVCGAGDTFLASLVYSYLETNNIDDAINFAIKASSITVQRLGVYAPTLEEICD